MIIGKITTYKEPEKYKYQQRNYHWMSEWEGYDEINTPQNWQEKDNEVLALVNTGTLRGLIQGARVKRSGPLAIQGLGTITHVHRSHGMDVFPKYEGLQQKTGSIN